MTTRVAGLEGPLADQYDRIEEVLTPLDMETTSSVNLGEVIRVSFESLAGNKTRSALTMLGVIIGVASVVALMALGNGAQASITGQIQSIGTNLIFVVPGSMSNRGPGTNASAQNLTMDDVQAISALGLPLNGIAPQFSGSADIVAPAADKYAQVAGTTPPYFTMQDIQPIRRISVR